MRSIWKKIQRLLGFSREARLDSPMQVKLERYTEARRVLVYKLPGNVTTHTLEAIRRDVRELPFVEASDVHAYENLSSVIARAKNLDELGPLSVHIEQIIEQRTGTKLNVAYALYKGSVPYHFRIRQHAAA